MGEGHRRRNRGAHKGMAREATLGALKVEERKRDVSYPRKKLERARGLAPGASRLNTALPTP